jgi:hypothetical protein
MHSEAEQLHVWLCTSIALLCTLVSCPAWHAECNMPFLVWSEVVCCDSVTFSQQ